VAEPLQALTALGHVAPEKVEIGPYRIAERFDVALASLACRQGRAADVATAALQFGLTLPGPARATLGAPYGAFWIAPDMWIIEAPFSSHEEVVAHLKPLFAGSASITEQTDAWVRFDLTALDLQPLLERLCNVDFRTAPPGFASRTVIEHTGCYLIRRSEAEVTLYGPRSSAQSLLHAITVAATSVI
jgi:sarcosine oxidase, subunit gamma